MTQDERIEEIHDAIMRISGKIDAIHISIDTIKEMSGRSADWGKTALGCVFTLALIVLPGAAIMQNSLSDMEGTIVAVEQSVENHKEYTEKLMERTDKLMERTNEDIQKLEEGK